MAKVLFGGQASSAGNLSAESVCAGIEGAFKKVMYFSEAEGDMDATPAATLVEAKQEVVDDGQIPGNPLSVEATDVQGVPGGDAIAPNDVIPSPEAGTTAIDVPVLTGEETHEEVAAIADSVADQISTQSPVGDTSVDAVSVGDGATNINVEIEVPAAEAPAEAVAPADVTPTEEEVVAE